MPGHAPAYSNCSPEGLVILLYDSIGMRARENADAGRRKQRFLAWDDCLRLGGSAGVYPRRILAGAAANGRRA